MLSCTTSLIGPNTTERAVSPFLRKVTISSSDQPPIPNVLSELMLGARNPSTMPPASERLSMMPPIGLRGEWHSPQWPAPSTR